jgi:hypothetical protein
LTDLAGDGGGILFVDGIDRFDDVGQHNTVADLLQEASQIPGFRVVVTARADFDSDARAWLSAQAIQALGPAPALFVDELSAAEVERLRQADPALAALLRAGHPAEKVVRNLYRLDRLSRSVGTNVSALTEAQMAKQWWDTGDGAAPANRLDRQRVLRTLAVHLLNSSAPMDTSGQPSEAIRALIESGTLQQVTATRVQLTHDVLGDWAIGCLLFEEPECIATLPLSNPAPTRLARGLEIAAQLHAELSANATGWRTLLTTADGAHGSWRRAVLLAPARSERSADLLSRCLSELKTHHAPLLAEIVRTAIVIDSQPAAPIWATLGIDTSKFTDDFALPRGPAWLNLITWSLADTDKLPAETIPQWVDLYGRWCNGFLGQDVLSPILLKQLHKWLVAAEATSHPRSLKFETNDTAATTPRLSLSDGQLRELRHTFLAWSKLCPGETASYLRAIADHPYRHVIFQELVRFVGTAPYAAPQALADLLLQVLSEDDSNDNHRSYRDLFSRWDLEYMPASPARPPFLDLLQAGKEHGLRLIRGLVAYAIQERSGGRDPGADQIKIPFPDGERFFPWKQSYGMSRSDQSYIVRSALMALEAWAHLRIEQGEPIEAVIEDVLGPEGSPAAYLLVAVDVLLSHWPQSRAYIWPFAASARLLAIDHMRYAQDSLGQLPQPWLHPEPAASVRLDDLLRRPSRRLSLSIVLRHFVVDEPAQIRESVRHALEAELAKLGPPKEDDAALSDPSVMAAHALNLINPENHAKRTNSAGIEGFQYVPPAEEAAYFTRLRQQSEQGETQIFLISRLTRAIAEANCPAPLLEQGIAWASRESTEHDMPENDERDMIDRAKLIVAALVLRDGSSELRSAHGVWAAQQLGAEAKCDTTDRGPKQLPYNRAAIALIGLLAARRHDSRNADLMPLLQLAAAQTSDVIGVLRAELEANRPVDTGLTRTLLRLALSSAIYAVRQRDDDWNRAEDYQTHYEAKEAARNLADNLRLQAAVEAELQWLMEQGPEPTWPELPAPTEPRIRRGLRIGAAQLPEAAPPPLKRALAFDSSTGAGVMTLAVDLWRVDNPELLKNLVRHAWPWTAAANGVGFGPDYESDERASEWNQSYFPAAIAVAISIGKAEIEKYTTAYLSQLPEKEFLIAAEAVLHALDQWWLGDHAISDDDAVALREAIAQRVQATWYWHRLKTERSSSIALDAAGAVASIFMCNYLMGGNIRCYVLPPGMIRIDRCLPMLTQLAEETAGSTFVALAMLSLLEVDPHVSRLGALSRLVSAWWTSQEASTDFWIDHGVAKRVCDWIGKAVLDGSVSVDEQQTAELTSILDILQQSGTPLARSLEERITAQRTSER